MIVSRFLLHRRGVSGGFTGPLPGTPPFHYLWLYDQGSNSYVASDDGLYILVPDPNNPP